MQEFPILIENFYYLAIASGGISKRIGQLKINQCTAVLVETASVVFIWTFRGLIAKCGNMLRPLCTADKS